MTIGRHSFAERPKTRGPRAPKTAPLHIRSAALGNQCACARRIPRLADERHDLALATLPCEVEGRLIAVLGSKRHIGAPFEKALGDREVAVVCRPMQC